MKVPPMPNLDREEPKDFASLPRDVQDAIIFQTFGGGLSASVARTIYLSGKTASDVNPPEQQV